MHWNFMLTIRKFIEEDYLFVENCLENLLSEKKYSVEMFKEYFNKLIAQKFGKVEVWIAEQNNQSIGCITANWFSIPRYLGYGIELEEVVILPLYQRKGYGRKFLELIIDLYSLDKECRKISVKTDDIIGAGKLYGTLLSETKMISYQQFLNKL